MVRQAADDELSDDSDDLDTKKEKRQLFARDKLNLLHSRKQSYHYPDLKSEIVYKYEG